MTGHRRRTVTWEDPQRLVAAPDGRGGLELLSAMAAGELPPPPIARLLGMELEVVEAGRVVFALEPGEYLYNPLGSVHGGVSATLLDSAMGCAVHSMLPAGAAYTTLELKVNYVRPIVMTTGRVLAEGTVVHRGGTVSTAEGRITSAADGRLLAHASTTCLILGGTAERRMAA
jgi:uncharacterized protein (TIGR00369 family)